MGFLSKSKMFHRSERQERAERAANSNPYTANPGEPPRAPRMPDLPDPPKEPEIKSCLPTMEKIKDDAVHNSKVGAFMGAVALGAAWGASAGPIGAVGGAVVGAVGGAIAGATESIGEKAISYAFETKKCNDKAKDQYKADLARHQKAEELAKQEFEQRSVEYIQYKYRYEAQKNRYHAAYDAAREHRDYQRPSETFNSLSNGGSSNLGSDLGADFSALDGGPADNPYFKSPMPATQHPYVMKDTPPYQAPNPLEFKWPSKPMTTSYQATQQSGFKFETFAERCERTKPRFR